MSDRELWRAFKAHKKEQRTLRGVPCPMCVQQRPKASPSILLPGQRCRLHQYTDPRPECS